MEPGQSEISVEEIMRRIREEVRRRKKLAPEERGGPSFSFPSPPEKKSPGPEPVPVREGIDLHQRTYQLEDFLKYHDREFVINAYRGILKREPDPEGLEHYLQNLRSGQMSKVEILGRLRFSPEGRRQKVKIKGLLPVLGLRLSYKVPGLGHLSRLLVGLGNLPTIIRNFEKFEAYTHALCASREEQWRQEMAGLHASLAQKTKLLEETLDAFRQELAQKAEREEFSSLRQEIESLRRLVQDQDRQFDHFATELMALREQVGQKMDRHEEERLLAEIRDLREEMRVLKEREVAEEKWRQVFQEFLKELAALKEALEKQASGPQAENLLLPLLEELSSLRRVLEEREGRTWQEGLKHLRDEIFYLRQGLEQKASQEMVEAMGRELQDLRQERRLWYRRLTGLERHLLLFLEEARKCLRKPTAEGLEEVLNEERHLFDGLYFALEEHFRGPREEIKERLKVYLPYVREAMETLGGGLVLDLGCGRGEWLELLREEGFEALGVDLNHLMVEVCREQGLEVVEADVLEYLRQQEAETFSVITAFHLVEHLPLRQMIALFDECLRVLKPGGLVIFETPNPENILVGACYFYMDPTHRNPIPPETLKFLVEERGFTNVEIIRLHKLNLDLEDNFLSSFFTKEQDYSVIAYKA